MNDAVRVAVVDPSASAPAPPAADADGRRALHADRLAVLGRSVAMIVHDVVQPVASVATRGQGALRWLRQDPPDVARAIASLESLVADAGRAGTVLADLRGLACPQARPPQPVPLDGVLRDTLRWLDDDLRRHGVTAALDLPAAPLPVLGERAALQQLFVNLVVNAIEAMAGTDAAPRAARPLTVTLRADGHAAVATISDRGCGLAADALPRLFEPFQTTKADGMGVGLSICRRIVADHGGTIDAMARPGGGTTFVVRLPCAAA
ncbi:ATP-binding protein [Cupriavidus sp. SZY C1]|uniref:sensor histidine kinase n=1 Tax=Cupriavidus sp. SZY C1 TaxID=3055037 RepID=UPI0028BCC711|nr:ATP-binding protein [Cupriavidus sp. SZY C1]MDT6960714.1 ATP-binding protein [Cupriavidus sp. SZY C1]